MFRRNTKEIALIASRSQGDSLFTKSTKTNKISLFNLYFLLRKRTNTLVHLILIQVCRNNYIPLLNFPDAKIR